MTRALAPLLAALLAAACREPPPPAALLETPREERASSSAALDTGALGNIPGNSPTADLLRAQQARVRAQPRAVRGYVQLARLFTQHARESEDPSFYVQAGDAVRRALELDPRDLESLQLQAQLFLQDHRFRDARDAARALEARAAGTRGAPLPETLGVLSDALLELGDYEGSVRAAQRMVDARPDSQSYVRAAWLRWVHGDAEGALEGMRLALDAMPRMPEARAWILTQTGVLHWNQGDLAAAQRYFDAALAQHPPFSAAHAGLARIALARGDAATAAREAEAAVRASPIAEHQWLAGDALTAAGRAGDAARYYEALERIGRRADPRTLALYYATAHPDRDAARALELARAEHESRQDVFTDDVLAWALFRAGDLAAAGDMITRARRVGTRDARLLYHLGMIRLAQGDRAAAAAALRDALAANPYWDAREAADARRALASMGEPLAAPATSASAAAPSPAPSVAPTSAALSAP